MSKVVLITGASAGIGKSAALHFHEQGWRVAATMRKPDAATWAPNGSDRWLGLPLDVTDEASIEAAFSTLLEKWGTLDVLVNNAGYGLLGPFEATSPEQVRRQFDTNVLGLMSVTRRVLPHLRERREGVIVNISSVGGRVTFPLYSCYHSTKWAVEGFTESLQFELKPFNIRLKLVEPGPIKTEFYDRSQDKVSMPEYEGLFQSALQRMHDAGLKAPGPEVVAATIFRAATDGSWKLRYPVNSADLLWLRKLLPEGLFRAAVGWYLGRP